MESRPGNNQKMSRSSQASTVNKSPHSQHKDCARYASMSCRLRSPVTLTSDLRTERWHLQHVPCPFRLLYASLFSGQTYGTDGRARRVTRPAGGRVISRKSSAYLTVLTEPASAQDCAGDTCAHAGQQKDVLLDSDIR